MQRLLLAATLTLPLPLAACARPEAPPPAAQPVKLDVPYVRTHDRVVDWMLDAASVGADDVLYDLGCGDGRIVITAARERGARGLGVDIDPARITESRESARRAGVEDRVRFAVQDLFETDLREATVVALYLLPEVNLKLRPRLLADLRPGARVVSHQFDMGEWKPDRSVEIGGESVFLWVIPARVEGDWSLQVGGAGSGEQGTIRIRQRFQELSGSARLGGDEASLEEAPLEEASLGGASLAFTIRRAGGALRFEGRAAGDAITGTMTPAGGGEARAFTATRTRQASF